MSVFQLEQQNSSLDNKIVAGLERLSQAFRVLLWEQAKAHNLSPIQIQLLVFIAYHSAEKTTISYLAQEFNFTKPTISDSVKVLEQKGLLQKKTTDKDGRSYTIQLTATGQAMVAATENFVEPIATVVAQASAEDKAVLWQQVNHLVATLNRLKIIELQRMCFNCQYYRADANGHFCALLDMTLLTEALRIDCPEFQAA